MTKSCLTPTLRNKKSISIKAEIHPGIEGLLLSLPFVFDGTALVCPTQKGIQSLYVFVVTDATHLKTIEQEVKQSFPHSVFIVPVRSIPRDQNGRIDFDILFQVELIDPELLNNWEKAVSGVLGTDLVAALTEEFNPPSKLIHLNRILPPETGLQSDTLPKHQQKSTIQTTLTQKLAISHGAPLQSLIPTNLQAALREAAENFPQHSIHYIESDGTNSQETYQELYHRARRIMGGIRSQKLLPGDKAILQLCGNREFIGAFWGCVLAGIVPIPLSTPISYDDSNTQAAKLKNTWKSLKKPLVICTPHLENDLSSFLKGHDSEIVLRALPSLSSHQEIEHSSHPEDLALLLYTSGSTGIPKGVMLTHSNLIHRSASSIQYDAFSPKDISLNWMPLDHVGGIVMYHLRDVMTGCKQIQAHTSYILENPLRWLELIHQYQVTITWAPNFAFSLINERADQLKSKNLNLSSLRFILNGGEAIAAKTARRFLTLLIPHGLPPEAMKPAWGMSETSSGVTSSHSFTLQSTTDQDQFVEVGPPLPCSSIRIVDAENNPVEEGMSGRVQIRGKSVTPGYFEQPELNEKTFTRDGWFQTGDLGKLVHGSLTITGREKDVIIINGLNYYPHEIESVVEEIAPVEVSYTTAVGIRNSKSHTDDLVLFFCPLPGADLVETIQTIKNGLAERSGIFPSIILPLSKTEIPKTSIGKIQRSQIKNRFLEGHYRSLITKIDLLLKNDRTLPQWFYQQTWKRKEISIASITPSPQVALVFKEGNLFHEELKKCIPPFITPIVVEKSDSFSKHHAHAYSSTFEVRDIQKLIKTVIEEHGTIHQILYFWNLKSPTSCSADIKLLLKTQRKHIQILQAILRELNSSHPKNFSSTRLLMVTQVAQPVLHDSEFSLHAAMFRGFLHTASQELSWLKCKHLDLDEMQPSDSHLSWESVIREITSPDRDIEVAYRRGHRFCPGFVENPIPDYQPDRFPIKRGGIYLVTGGLGGIGASLSRFLIEEFQAKLILVGRTPFPDRKQWEEVLRKDNKVAQRLKTYLELEQSGGSITYHSTNLSSLNELQEIVLQSESTWGGKLDGIFHLAGDIGKNESLEEYWNHSADHSVLNEKIENFETLLEAKGYGTWILYQLLNENPKALFVAFSSVNGILGGAYFGAYASANSFQDRLVSYQRKTGHPLSYSLNWNMWDQTGLSRGSPEAARSASQQNGFSILSASQGIYSLMGALCEQPSNLTIGIHERAPFTSHRVFTEEIEKTRIHVYFENIPNPNLAELQNIQIQNSAGIPSWAEIIGIPKIPVTEKGHIDRHQIQQLRSTPSLQSKKPEPSTFTEKEIARIWKEVLNLSVVGKNDHFFLIGGKSLTATQVLSRLKNTFSIELSLLDLFKNPILENLALLIEQKSKSLRSQTISIPRSLEKNIPLSYSQRQLWFLDQLSPGNLAYLVPSTWKLKGKVDPLLLEKSLQELIQRHAALRTYFPTRNGEAFQDVFSELLIKLEILDFSPLPTTKQKQAVEQALWERSRQPFNLSSEPLIRAHLITLSKDESILLIVIHHIIFDGWSQNILITELARIYHSLCSNHSSHSPLPDLSYRDFTQWQRQLLQERELDHELAFWKKYLSGTTGALELPLDRPRPSIQTYRGATHTFSFSTELSNSILQYCQNQGITLFTFMLSIYQILIHRYTGQEDIVIGSPLASRNQVETEKIIGFFANTLPIRNRVVSDATFRDFLKQTEDSCLQVFQNQNIPFEKIVEEIQPVRDLNRSPIFQVAFVNPVPLPSCSTDDLKIESIKLDNGTSKFDWTLSIEEFKGTIRGFWEFNLDLFNSGSIERSLGHFQQAILSILKNHEIKIADISILTPEEESNLLNKWNHTDSNYPRNSNIASLFENQVQKNPHAIALSFKNRDMTYVELNTEANRLARYLQSTGIPPKAMIGICMDRSIEMIVGVLGILKAGCAYVPFDSTYPPERLRYMMEDSGVQVILTQQLFKTLLPTKAQMVCLDLISDELEKYQLTNLNLPIQSEDLAYTIYSSGSTGKPKGILIPHRGVMRLVAHPNYIQIQNSDVVAQASNVSFDAATFEIWGALLNGAKLAILPKEIILSPKTYAEEIEKASITTIFLTTALFNEMAKLRPTLFRDVHHVLFGGEAVNVHWVKEILKQGPPKRLLHVYGPTEATTYALWHQVSSVDEQDHTIPIGNPISDTKAYVLDKHKNLLPLGIPGELYLSGEGLALAYHQQPELTREKFISNPFSSNPKHSLLYRTGDLVKRRPDGSIEFIGRMDHQVKIRGFRIELGEIESLLRAHPGIKEALVITHSNPRGEKQIAAYLIFNSQQTLQTQELKSFLGEKLPDYMIPTYFIPLKQFPLNPNGKIDKKALPAPSFETHRKTESRPITNEIEKRIFLIWNDVLELSDIGRDDNFFDLGGHSLRLAEVHSKLSEHYPNLLTMMDLLRYPSISSLSSHIQQRLDGESSTLTPKMDASLPSSERTNRLKSQLERRKRSPSLSS